MKGSHVRQGVTRSRTTGALALASLLVAAGGAEAQVDLRQLGHFQGNPFAPVQVVEFADFGCSACGMFTREVKPAIVREFIDTGRVGWRMIPIRLSRFRHSAEATRAAECTADEETFWALEQKLYDEQKEWQAARDVKRLLEGYVREVGADLGAWRRCYEARDYEDPVPANNRVARRLRVRGTPTFYINDTPVIGAIPYQQFASLLEAAEQAAFER